MSGENLYSEQIRVLVVAQHPFRVDDLGVDDLDDIGEVRLVRRLAVVAQMDDLDQFDVALMDTTFPEGRSFKALEVARARHPEIVVLALTPDPPPHGDVARSMQGGAIGFVDVAAEPAEFAEAIRCAARGEDYLPAETTRQVLADVAGDLDVTVAERRSRLMTVALGLIPIAGAVAAILALLWRRYLANVGIRPVDLAVDPTSRVVDALFWFSLLLGVFGPLLYVRTWLDELEPLVRDRPGLRWVATRRTLTGLLMAVCVVAVGLFLAWVNDPILVLFVGPVVFASILAFILDLSDQLPRAIRITFDPRRTMIGTLAVLFVFLGILSYEVTFVGPNFTTSGVQDTLTSRVLGFSAQPALVFDADGEEAPRELLYVGGNADLYVLADPCNDDLIEYVSVGSSRIEIIDEVSCE
ncbi:MAG: hypothetical protein ACR2PK_13930 [Acidimicrobiales bacterium]